MPVSTGSLGEPRAKRCKLCDESSHRSESGSGFWQLQLDRDLVDTISAIYPEWFQNNMAEEGSPSAPRESPPKAVIDTSPLHIDQNKESLKVKLMLRRPFDQLVAQGIMPPHKTPAAYHGQRRQLERAKTGDMLKAKIQQRPPRQELERRHILEADPGHVDPSLAERQRMLKKARLADQLNDQLSHRPGPLELIQKNILHTEEPIEQAVKTGRIPYKATSEGQLTRPQHPNSYINPEDDSQSSEGDNIVSPGPSDVIETAAKSAGIVVSLLPATEGTVVVTTATPVLNNNKDNSELVFTDLCRSVAAPLLPLPPTAASSPASLVSSTSTLSPLSSIASPVPSIVSQPATPIPPPPPPPSTTIQSSVILTQRPIQTKSDAPGKDKNRKKSKSKSTPKARIIKFHEYKGPPSAQKNSNNNNNASGETSYDLLLQQQTLLLQFQLQLQHKYPQIILPASQKSNENQNIVATCNNNSNNTNNSCNSNNQNSNNSNSNSIPSPAPSTSSESSTPTRLIGRLEDMKVGDLKAELKRRNLPVSGSKPQLIERLKPFTKNNDLNNLASMDSSSNLEQAHNSPQYQENGSPQGSIKDEQCEQMEIGEPPSPLPQKQLIDQFQQQEQKTKEDIVKEQQRQIEELQRELTLSQLKLQAATRVEPKAQLLALQKHLQARQQQQQQQQHIALQMQQLQALQARQAHVNEEQQRLQQQQHVAFQNQKNLPSHNSTRSGLLLNGADAALVLNLMQGKAKLINGHTRTNSLPNFLNSIVTPTAIIATATPQVKTELIEDVKSPPSLQMPLYEEVKFSNSNNNNSSNDKKNNVKSQIVDDVLEILIKNGELPPSAANDPATPNSAGTKVNELVFPSNNQQQQQQLDPELGLDPTEILDSIDNLDMDFSQFVMELGGSGSNQQQNMENNNNIENDDESMSVPMDTDDWLESLCVLENGNNGSMSGPLPTTQDTSDLVGYDPLLGLAQDPFDPFNLEEFRSSADLTASLSWDKVDYTA